MDDYDKHNPLRRYTNENPFFGGRDPGSINDHRDRCVFVVRSVRNAGGDQEEGAPALRSAFTFRFIGVAIVVGMAAAFVYTSLARHFPHTAIPLFLGLGLGLPLGMSLAARFVLPKVGITADLNATWGRIMLLNVVWGLSYGMINPLILRFA